MYYQEREARRAARAAQRAEADGVAGGPEGGPGGPQNHGWDDENFDYLVTPNELLHDGRYRLQRRIGKGSFGQVVKAVDVTTSEEVAIKIIKSKRPFLLQARTEIGLLEHLNARDPRDGHHIVRLLSTFVHRNHQCLVFEMLSLNLYELLKNTHFLGVSLNLIRKFAKQILKSLAYLARPDVDVIHCDLKPENILLRHPKRSGIKVIDFGSSCRSDKRMYSYIQSRFYRSPEVLLGLPYGVPIDMWSLGCILVEMHTGEPLFSGSDQCDQMRKIVAVLGMVPDDMLAAAGGERRDQFFQRGPDGTWTVRAAAAPDPDPGGSAAAAAAAGGAASSLPAVVVPSADPTRSLRAAVTREAGRKKRHASDDPHHSARQYDSFVDLVRRMLAYRPAERLRPDDALAHPFVADR